MKKIYLIVFLIIGATALAHNWLEGLKKVESNRIKTQGVQLVVPSYDEHDKAECFAEVKNMQGLKEITPVCTEHSSSQILLEKLNLEKLYSPALIGNIDYLEDYIKEGNGFLYFDVEEK